MEFDPEILKRFVNFMNNPDEETAVAQFGKGDKYFGICTLLVTMPGLPMFGHGQIEGFEEKYGMEYRRAYRDEKPDGYLVDRHEREIFPLMKRRALFSGSSEFRLYDLYTEGGSVNENVFAYSNRAWIYGHEEKALIFYNNSYYETAGWIKISDPAIPCNNGKRRDSLHQALALHHGDNWFTMFKDQRTNLWYIRSSKAINENGFFVALKGYEAQVFIDIYEIEDDTKGRWARLHHDLQGRGVDNPQSAIMDIYLGDLYYRFLKPLKPELINQLHDFFTAGTVVKQKTQAFIESLKETAEKYFETVAWFIKGADGKFEPWDAKESTASSRVPENMRQCGSPNDDRSKTDRREGAYREAVRSLSSGRMEQPWEEFKGYVERLIGLVGYLNATDKTPAERMLKELALRMKERQLVCAAALGYGLLSVLRSIIGRADGGLAANLAFEHWDLDRKLKEQFRVFGANDDEVWRLGEICKAVLYRTGMDHSAANSDTVINKKTSAFDAGLLAASLIIENHPREDFRRLIGVNVFNDITWFNKEAFESALFYGKLFFVLESESALSRSDGTSQTWHDRTARIAEVTEAMKNAEIECGYRLDKLIQLLSGEEMPLELKPKKPTATKKPIAVKKPATAKKLETKKPEIQKSQPKKPTAAKKPATKKPEPKKPLESQPKKPASTKTTAAKKPKPAAKKPAVKKPAPKKTTTGKKTVKGKKRNET
jgi:hypothetical protein